MKRFFEELICDIVCKIKDEVAVFPHYHRHDGYEIFILLNGDVNYYIEQHSYRLTRGSLILINPEEYHRAELIGDTAYERMVLNVRKPFFEKLSTYDTDLSLCFSDRIKAEDNFLQLNAQDLQFLHLQFSHLKDALRDTSYGNDLLGISYLLQILVKTNRLYRASQNSGFSNPPDVMPRLIQDTMMYIEEHLAEEITLSDLSATFFHNGTYISRCFKGVTGLTISQYVLYKRISLAQKYLLEGYSLTDVCLMSGFNNYSNFSRSFTKQVGCSPKKYQNMHNK